MEEIIPFLGEETIGTVKDSLVLLGVLFLAAIIWVFIGRDNSDNDE